MSKKRKRYAAEFKLRAVEKSYQVSNISHLAAELGIRPELAYRWRACKYPFFHKNALTKNLK